MKYAILAILLIGCHRPKEAQNFKSMSYIAGGQTLLCGNPEAIALHKVMINCGGVKVYLHGDIEK